MSRQHPESLCPRYEGRVGEEFNPSSWHLIKSPKMLFCGTPVWGILVECRQKHCSVRKGGYNLIIKSPQADELLFHRYALVRKFPLLFCAFFAPPFYLRYVF